MLNKKYLNFYQLRNSELNGGSQYRTSFMIDFNDSKYYNQLNYANQKYKRLNNDKDFLYIIIYI